MNLLLKSFDPPEKRIVVCYKICLKNNQTICTLHHGIQISKTWRRDKWSTLRKCYTEDGLPIKYRTGFHCYLDLDEAKLSLNEVVVKFPDDYSLNLQETELDEITYEGITRRTRKVVVGNLIRLTGNELMTK